MRSLFVGFVVDGWLRSLIVVLPAEATLIPAFSAIPALTLPGATALLAAVLLYASLALFSAIDQVAGDRVLIDVTRRETRSTIKASLASLVLISRIPAPLIGAAVATRRGLLDLHRNCVSIVLRRCATTNANSEEGRA